MTDYSTLGNVFDLDLESIEENIHLKGIEEKCKMRRKVLINEWCRECIVKECEQGCIAAAISLGNEFGDDGECGFRKKVAVLNKVNELI